MRKNVIYYPYIRVPESTWLTQMLLYWDRVDAIVPYHLLHDPEGLGEHTLALVREELVHQIHPGAYVYGIEGFVEGFADHLNGLGMALEDRRMRLAAGDTTDVHIEKLDRVVDLLLDMNLADQPINGWQPVERATAMEFMAYLARHLGQLEEIESDPVTDCGEGLLESLGYDRGDLARADLSQVRMGILEDILPTPDAPLAPQAIRTLKDKHGEHLGRFRRRVEREVIAIAALPSNELRERQAALFQEEAQEQIDALTAWLEEHTGFKAKTARVAGVAADRLPVVGTVRAAAQATADPELEVRDPDFLYAAHVARVAGVE